MSNNELRHFKYVDKYKKNGKWIYVYPGANDRTSTSGKQMSKLQQDKAKYMANVNKKISGASKEDQKQYREQYTITWHENQLRGSNSRTHGEGKEKPVQQTTKKQIRQGIRRAKIKTLKRDAAQAISRAQDWVKKLFD